MSFLFVQSKNHSVHKSRSFESTISSENHQRVMKQCEPLLDAYEKTLEL